MKKNTDPLQPNTYILISTIEESMAKQFIKKKATTHIFLINMLNTLNLLQIRMPIAF